MTLQGNLNRLFGSVADFGRGGMTSSGLSRSTVGYYLVSSIVIYLETSSKYWQSLRGTD